MMIQRDMLDTLNIATLAPSKSNEWYTPARYIEAAREVMGSIDLDPASCEVANRTVRAKRYFTECDNGLAQEWYGNVWINPPYNSTDDCKFPQPAWTRKLQHEYHLGHVEQAILLVSPNTKQVWFHELLECVYLFCFTKQRIWFIRPGKTSEELRHGNTFFYLGPNEQKFIDVFSQFGTIARRVSPARRESVFVSLWDETG